MAVCAAANSFGTPSGGEYMTRADVMPGWLDTSLSGKSVKLHAFCSAKWGTGASTFRDIHRNGVHVSTHSVMVVVKIMAILLVN